MKTTVIILGIILIIKGLNITAKQELHVPGGKELGAPEIGDPEIVKGTPARVVGGLMALTRFGVVFGVLFVL
ncbi:MAG: hypothetical protein ACKVJU_18420 [Verrucomicrobiales bacterium]